MAKSMRTGVERGEAGGGNIPLTMQPPRVSHARTRRPAEARVENRKILRAHYEEVSMGCSFFLCAVVGRIFCVALLSELRVCVHVRM